MGKHTARNVALIAIVAVIGYFVLGGDTSFLTQQSISGTQQTGTGTPVVSTTGNAYTGDATIKIVSSDALDSSTAYTDGTNFSISYYEKLSDGSFKRLATSASNSATINKRPDLNTIYAGVSIPSGQTKYIAANPTVEAHPLVQTPTWADANLDNLKEYIFPIDISGMGAIVDPNNAPTMTWFPMVFDQGTITIDSPADDSTNGQGLVKSIIKWSADFTAAGTAKGVTEARITMNQTDTTMWSETQSFIEIPNGNSVDKIYLVDMDRSDLASTTVYKYQYSTDQQNANFLVVGKNGDVQIETPFTIYSNFDANDEGITVTYQLTSISGRGAFATTSDAVKVLET